ncbi:MAG: hypothetical protein WDN31_06230 [Hyphomicrobium sp.]
MIATGSLDTLAFLAIGALVAITCELLLYRKRVEGNRLSRQPL